ncbi:MAG TPA: hypothetical protein VGM05_00630 [Planctomycetaceae bacterium]|jgi:hypothetical protein
MPESVAEIAMELDKAGPRPESGDSFNEIHQKLVFFRKSHYDQYVPTIGADYADFERRLLRWLCNTDNDEERRTLFELAPRLTFFTREDFAKLHQAALAGPITRWIVDQMGLSFDDPRFDEVLSDEIQNHTWYCSITDSMQIADFHHANNLGGIDFRPDWRSLAEFCDPAKIQNFMANRQNARREPTPVRRIVILEDFIGSGMQMEMGKGSVAFAAATFPNVRILLVPLVICPLGAKIARELSGAHTNLEFDPVIELRDSDLVTPGSSFAHHSLGDRLQKLVANSYSAVVGDGAAHPRPYSAFGLANTGAQLILYSNAPANTIALIHHQSNTWNALFPRSARIR